MSFFLPSTSSARTIEGEVVKVADGHTITMVTAEGTKLRTRLYGIDAPEIRHGKKPGQPYGEDAKRALAGLVLGMRVRLDILDVDRYKRMVGMVYLNGKNVNEEMIRRGLAWAYRQYLDTPYASEFIAAEKEAREKGLGLWKRRTRYRHGSSDGGAGESTGNMNLSPMCHFHYGKLSAASFFLVGLRSTK